MSKSDEEVIRVLNDWVRFIGEHPEVEAQFWAWREQQKPRLSVVADDEKETSA